MLEVRLLGTFQVKCGKRTVEIASRPAQSLFAYLILNAGTTFRRERLAGQLWPDSGEESARDYLRHALWRIRKALQGVSAAAYLQANDLAIAFDASKEYWLDASALTALDAKASAHQIARAAQAYKGELLPGFYDEWVLLERDRLQSVYEQQVARLLDILQEQGRWNEVLEWSERWLSFGQRPEAAYRHLMSAHAAQGEMAKAAAAYERCVKVLAELGFEPSEQTRRLHEELKRGRRREQTAAVELPSVTPRAASSVLAPLTSFVGREKELAEILRLLKNQRLLTLLGPGGVGKTRLAIEAAHRLAHKFDDVLWIDPVGLSDGSLVPQAVLQASGLHEIPSQPALQTIIEHYALRRSLFVLDNCEHMITACAQLVDRLLGGCRNLRILATSREALDILGETTWTVPSLGLPELLNSADIAALAKAESVRLFMERVALANPQFELGSRNGSSVVQICTRLGGMPLAIELAAARVKVMTVEEIARRLDDTFSLLTGGNRAAIPRHQTLRATIDWSYELLSDNERVLFRRLAIFADGFTLEAVEAVAPDNLISRSQVVDLLGHLVSKSLVSAVTGSWDPETRYRVLETIRQYAHDKLAAAGEFVALKKRHLEFCADLALRAESGIYSAQQAQWFARLDKEADNLRAALDWAHVSDDPNSPPKEWVRNKQFAIISAPVQYLGTRLPARDCTRREEAIGTGPRQQADSRACTSTLCDGFPVLVAIRLFSCPVLSRGKHRDR